MIKKSIFAATIAVLAMPMTASAQASPLKDYSGSYLCKPMASTGLVRDKSTSEWLPKPFKTENVAYIVKVVGLSEAERIRLTWDKNQVYTISVKDFEGDGKENICGNSIMPKGEEKSTVLFDGFTECSFGLEQYRFDFNRLLIQVYFAGSYMSDGTSTPYIEVGKCQRID